MCLFQDFEYPHGCPSTGSLAKQATSLSIPLISLKLPPISSIAYSTARAKDWDNVITAHTDEPMARTWTIQSKKIGHHTFKFAENAKKNKSTPGSCQVVCVTACGNFGIAGSSTGLIHMWNMQSGILRKTFDIGPRYPDTEGKNKPKKVARAITGLATDALNTVVVASTLDGTINVCSISMLSMWVLTFLC
jgi:U3 small nucleolar RNA-associated protein 21